MPTRAGISAPRHGQEYVAAFRYIALFSAGLYRFIQGNLASGITASGLDDVDIDWEFPTATDTSNFTLLLTEFRKQLDRINRNHWHDVSADIRRGRRQVENPGRGFQCPRDRQKYRAPRIWSCKVRYIALYYAGSYFTNSGGVCHVNTFPAALAPSSADDFVGPRCMHLPLILTKTQSRQDSRGILRRVEYLLRWLQHCKLAAEWCRR